MAKITMSAETLSKLLNMGYEMLDDGSLLKCKGSISNFTKIKINQPRLDETLNGEEVMFCPINYTQSYECGYMELDGALSFNKYVRESELISFLNDFKGILI